MRLTGALDYLTGALTCRSPPTGCGASIGGGARRFLIVGIAYIYIYLLWNYTYSNLYIRLFKPSYQDLDKILHGSWLV